MILELNNPFFKCIFLVVLYLLIFSIDINGQSSTYRHSSNKYKDRYIDYLEYNEIQKRSWYHYVATKTVSNEFWVRIFHPNTKVMTAKIQFANEEYMVKDGKSKEWYENGHLKSQGVYSKNLKEGIWKYYDQSTKKLSHSGYYKNNQKEGLWQYYKNGIKASAYTYRNDQLEGPFAIYDTLGNIINQGLYKDDMLYSQTLEEDSSDTLIISPMYDSKKCKEVIDYHTKTECAMEQLLRSIYKEINYPIYARDHYIQGRVLMDFIVTKEGKVENITFIQALCDEIEQECRRVINKLQNWIPASQNGELIDAHFSLPISFLIEE